MASRKAGTKVIIGSGVVAAVVAVLAKLRGQKTQA